MRPEAPAIVCGEQRLSYAALDAAGNRLAHRLQALGVTRDVPVGMCLEPGTQLLVAMLGVLKAGGAWLPHPVVARPGSPIVGPAHHDPAHHPRGFMRHAVVVVHAGHGQRHVEVVTGVHQEP